MEPAPRPIAAMSSVRLEPSERFLSTCRWLAAVDFGRITVFLEKLTIDCFGVADAGLTAFLERLVYLRLCFSVLLCTVVWVACCEFPTAYCVFAVLFTVENTVNRSNLLGGAGTRGGWWGGGFRAADFGVTWATLPCGPSRQRNDGAGR